MELTHTARYAIQALVLLATHQDGSVIASRDIGETHGISVRFLMKILRRLVNAGILYSVQGPGGGYRLKRTPRDVTLLEIVEAVDGPVRGRALVTWDAGHSLTDRQLMRACEQAALQLRRVYGNVRLSDLLRK
jgi:Rrf2 family protein